METIIGLVGCKPASCDQKKGGDIVRSWPKAAYCSSKNSSVALNLAIEIDGRRASEKQGCGNARKDAETIHRERSKIPECQKRQSPE
jgi:hypothetical protein